MGAYTGAARRRVHIATVLLRSPSGHRPGRRRTLVAQIFKNGLHLRFQLESWVIVLISIRKVLPLASRLCFFQHFENISFKIDYFEHLYGQQHYLYGNDFCTQIVSNQFQNEISCYRHVCQGKSGRIGAWIFRKDFLYQVPYSRSVKEWRYGGVGHTHTCVFLTIF